MATEEQKERLVQLLNRLMEAADLDRGRGIVMACRVLGIWDELEPRVRASAPGLYENAWPWW